MEEKKKLKVSLGGAIFLFLVILLIAILVGMVVYFKHQDTNVVETPKNTQTDVKQPFKYALKSNSLEDFDLRFLQLENNKVNVVYSPLSIKYALGMLNEGTDGESKEQISNLIGEYKASKYINSRNMSFANALFVRDTFKNSIKNSFVSNLESKYNADVVYDSFNSAEKMNSWISDKTLELLKDMLSDEDLSGLDFALVNALAIDMDWEDKFLAHNIVRY